MPRSESSPFGRSQLMRRSPPPTPSQQTHPIDKQPPISDSNEPRDLLTTQELQQWATNVDSYMKEICAIVIEGKMNSDQKLRVTNLCRKATSANTHIALAYQSLKQKTIQAYSTIQHLQAQQELARSIQDIKEVVKDKIKPAENTSFAAMVKKNADTFVRPSTLSSVVIYPNDKTQTSEETKTLVQKIVSPGELKLHVRGLTKVRNGGVIISTEDKGDVEKLKNFDKLASSGLKVEEPTKRRPRITIIGVPVSLTEDEVFNCIFEQNIEDMFPSATRESFLAAIKLSHKSGKKNPATCNYVLEVPASIRKSFINQGRIYIQWTSCPVRDFTFVTRCYNCQQYGHSAKYCRDTSPTCNHCGELGHTIKECVHKTSTATCATCKRFKKKCDHETGDVNCPARKYAEDKYINSIDYEGA